MQLGIQMINGRRMPSLIARVIDAYLYSFSSAMFTCKRNILCRLWRQGFSCNIEEKATLSFRDKKLVPLLLKSSWPWPLGAESFSVDNDSEKRRLFVNGKVS